MYSKMSEVPFGVTILCKFYIPGWQDIIKVTRIKYSKECRAVLVVLDYELNHNQPGSGAKRISWFGAEALDEKYIPFDEPQ